MFSLALKTTGYSSSPSTAKIICSSALVVFSSPPEVELSLREDRSLSQGKHCWCSSQGPQTEAAFGRCLLRIVNTGEGTDSSHHQFCSSASTAQNIFYHHTLSFFFISFLKEFKTVQCSCLPLFQPVAVLWLVVTIWGDGPPICPVQDSSHPGIPKDKPEDEFLGLCFHSQH